MIDLLILLFYLKSKIGKSDYFGTNRKAQPGVVLISIIQITFPINGLCINFYSQQSLKLKDKIKQLPMPIIPQSFNRSASSRSLSPQVKIYNRNFYLRQTVHDTLQQQYQLEIKKLSNTPKITQNSYIILAKKLQQTIFKAIEQNVQAYQQEGNITFQQMQKVLKTFLNFTKQEDTEEQGLHCQLWFLVSGYQIGKPVQIKVFSSVLRILLDPYNLTVKQMKNLIQMIPSLKNIDQKRLKFIQNNAQVEDETFAVNKLLTLWNQVKINKYIDGFKKSQKIPILTQRQHITFQPKISQNSRILAQKGLNRYLQANKTKYFSEKYEQNHESKGRTKHLNQTSPDELQRYLRSTNRDRQICQSRQVQEKLLKPKNLSYHDILYKRNLQKMDPKYQKSNQENDSQFINSQRSYTPKTSRKVTNQEMKQIVKNLYFIKERHKQSKEYDEQKQLKKCTFRPKINAPSSARGISPTAAVNANVKGFDKTVKRLKQGRYEEDRKKQMLENMGRVKKPDSLKNSRAPSFIERDTPKLILQVKIDHQRIQKIHLKGDQDPHIVAKKFILKHNLAHSMQSVLEQLVQQQLYNL